MPSRGSAALPICIARAADAVPPGIVDRRGIARAQPRVESARPTGGSGGRQHAEPSDRTDVGRTRLTEPHRRLMAAVLQAVVDDYQGGSARNRRRGRLPLAPGHIRKATAYVLSTDREWPFSFENLCDALSLDPTALRRRLAVLRDEELDRSGATFRAHHEAVLAEFRQLVVDAGISREPQATSTSAPR